MQILIYLHVNISNFHMKGFTLGLALKKRRKVTRKSSNIVQSSMKKKPISQSWYYCCSTHILCFTIKIFAWSCRVFINMHSPTPRTTTVSRQMPTHCHQFSITHLQWRAPVRHALDQWDYTRHSAVLRVTTVPICNMVSMATWAGPMGCHLWYTQGWSNIVSTVQLMDQLQKWQLLISINWI